MWATNPTLEIIEATSHDVNWIIFYFTFTYGAWLVHCIVEVTKKDYVFFGLMSLPISVRIFMELQCIGMGYGEYIENITNFKSLFVPGAWLVISLITIVVHFHYGRNKRII